MFVQVNMICLSKRLCIFCFLKSEQWKRSCFCIAIWNAIYFEVNPVRSTKKIDMTISTLPHCLGLLRAERLKLQINDAQYCKDVLETCPVTDSVIFFTVNKSVWQQMLTVTGVKITVESTCRLRPGLKKLKLTYLESNRRDVNKIATKRVSTLPCLLKSAIPVKVHKQTE